MTLALRPLFKSFILIFWYPICDSLSILNHYPREDPRRSKRRSYLSCLRRVFKASLVPLQLPWKRRRNFREIGLKKREQRRFRVASSFRRQIFEFRLGENPLVVSDFAQLGRPPNAAWRPLFVINREYLTGTLSFKLEIFKLTSKISTA